MVQKIRKNKTFERFFLDKRESKYFKKVGINNIFDFKPKKLLYVLRTIEIVLRESMFL